MRQSRLAAAVGSVLLLLASPVIARDTFEIPDSFPKTYGDLFKVIREQTDEEKKVTDQDKDEEKENIEAYLAGAQCGGWYKNVSVAGKIATVTGAPGHAGQWDGNIPSGMGVRDDAFSYPQEETIGLSTSCAPDTAVVQRTAWSDAAQGRVAVAVPNPLFKDPPCLWDATGAVDGPQDFFKCQASCSWMNTFVYDDCRPENIVPIVNAKGRIVAYSCAKWDKRYTCSEEWAGTNDGTAANCVECKGEACRCDGTQASCVKSTQNQAPYVSFYRRYGAVAQRDKVFDADDARKEAVAYCFGRYDEFDPKTKRTEAKDQNCTINMEIKGMTESQTAKGEYRSTLTDPTNDTVRAGRTADHPTWFTQLGAAFSLLQNTEATDKEKKPLASYFGNVDQLEQRSIGSADRSYTRAFDETGESRILSTWWQEQQTTLQTYVHGPVLRLVLPSKWAIGASSDPFLKDAAVTEKKSVDGHSESIEAQIDAGPDTLDEAISFIERSSTLQVTEEPIPVTIPLADPVELRAAAASWCAWVSSTSTDGTCDNAPANVKKLMDSLRRYADGMEDYRSLRTLLSEHVAEVLKLQNDVTKPLTDWMKQNVAKYKESVAARKKIATDVAPILDSAQELLRKFNDVSNMPWCMNQRFTLPIYSLLDPWLPSRANEGAVSADGLPSFPKPDKTPEDIVIDMSRLTSLQSPVSIPVLKPVQVRLDIPLPPDTDAIKELPEIGTEIEKIRTVIKQSKAKLPSVKTKGTPPAITLPEPVKAETIAKMKDAANQIFSMFSAMDRTYEDFWESLGPPVPKMQWTPQEEEIESQIGKCTPGVFPCIHVEMDLLERLMRIASRPLIMLDEDYASMGLPRPSATACAATDHVCLLMHPERTKPVQGWEIRGPATQSTSGFLDGIRSAILSITFPQPFGSADTQSIPPYDADVSNRAGGVETDPASPLLPPT